MVNYFLWFGVFFSLLQFSQQISSIESPIYVGGVAEYHAVTSGKTGLKIAKANSDNYLKIIKRASRYNVDIIVFPENGLTSLPKDGDKPKKFNATEFRAYYKNVASYVPNPKDKAVLCGSNVKYKKSLQRISCAAREHKMYVVVNHHEYADCPEPNCSSDNFLLYNTNIVFDRFGRVVARYRKYNLYHEDGTNVTDQPEYSTFTTDFGVTFGQFICADILHAKPATFFVENPKITDVVFSTHWLDELPFLDAIQYQAAWAYAADVNFLASAFSDELTASGGSGIYGGRNGPIRIHQPRETSNALIIADVSKFNQRKFVDDNRPLKSFVYVFNETEIPTILDQSFRLEFYPNFYHDDLRPYTTQVLDPMQKLHDTTVCDRGLCCDFHVEISYDSKIAALPNSTQYTYRLAVFNGVRNMVNVTSGGLEVCALVACAGDRVEDCGSLYPFNTWTIKAITFDKLMITRQANLDKRVLYVPSTLTTGKRRPISSEDFAYLTSGYKNSSLLVMYLVKPRTDLMTFGLYGRRFDRDGEKVTKTKSTTGSNVSRTVVIAGVLVVILFFWMRN